jgi:hypothetical protein
MKSTFEYLQSKFVLSFILCSAVVCLFIAQSICFPSVFSLFSRPCHAVTAIEGLEILQIQCLTVDEEDARMTITSININIRIVISSCIIKDLINSDNTFAWGAIIVLGQHHHGHGDVPIHGIL